MSTILTLSDMQIPFHNPDCLDFLSDLKAEYKPNKIIGLGDEIDAYNWSGFDKDPDVLCAGDELKKTIKVMKQLYKIFPKADILLSNHTGRIVKKMLRSGIPRQMIKSVKEVLEAPTGWNWHENIELDGIYFFHGDGFGGQQAPLDMIRNFHCNVVHGHLHSVGGVRYLNLGRETFWALSGGCLIDPTALAFEYGKTHKEKPILGTGLIVDGYPMFVPMGS